LYLLQRRILLCLGNPTYKYWAAAMHGFTMVLRPTAATTRGFTMVLFTQAIGTTLSEVHVLYRLFVRLCKLWCFHHFLHYTILVMVLPFAIMSCMCNTANVEGGFH